MKKMISTNIGAINYYACYDAEEDKYYKFKTKKGFKVHELLVTLLKIKDEDFVMLDQEAEVIPVLPKK